MKISEHWLREYANPAGDTAALVHQLTMQGLEVESLDPAAPPLPGVVVGRVLEVKPHPNADRLRVCRVDAGVAPLQIVCGASNVQAGGVYPVACVGAKLPDGTLIKPAKLRGEASEGMLCSATELGLAEKADGLLELDAGLQPGMPVAEALGLDDQIIDLKVTPNRADCFCVAGVARDLAAATGVLFRAPETVPVAALIDEVFPVTIGSQDDCPVFVSRVIRGLRSDVPSPFWLRERLRRSGIRSINPVVDVTNLVMIELGQPLHAYDMDTLSGGLAVRRGLPAEKLQLLTGDVAELDANVLVIADARGAVGMAGIMGGASTGVTEGTRNVVLESAFFRPAVVAGRARRFGLQTDAATRFERGVDPAGQLAAIERATTLLLDITGGKPGPASVWGALAEKRVPAVLLRRERLAQVLGHQVPDAEVVDILQRLDMLVDGHALGWQVQAASFRFDIAIEVDLIEEIARIRGYDRIGELPGQQTTRLGAASDSVVGLDRLKNVLVERGYQEAITYSFIDADLDSQFAGGAPGVPLVNPISAELAVMRQTLWPGLINAVRHNLARQQSRVRLFEAGVRFSPSGADALSEQTVIAGVAIGNVTPEQWDTKPVSAGFFDVKADVEALLRLAGDPSGLDFVAAEHSALQPGQTARILRDGVPVGWLGVLHPALRAALELPASPVLFEMDTAALSRARPRRYQALSRFPAVRRDLAILVASEIPAGKLLAAVAEAAGPALKDVVVFDIFADKRIGSGQKSVALGLILQETSRTLTDADIEKIISGVVTHLAMKFDARLRE
ncbi:MAG: phenylalanine--tRNA ligase subunit beta [Gammaproteobacteria bacterium]|nr:phenylalanine--tRNA ligase subunit beta [Gammaproteobacteria bacterium]MCP5138746.1 phenylalanine--tRNA ligase subunit beta [Chromatiales bacterium]